jgi:stage II sporulation protein D
VERLLGLTDLFGKELRPPPNSDWRESWSLEAGLAVLEILGVVERDSGEAVPHPEGVAIYPRRADRSELLVSPLPLYEAWGSSRRAVNRLEIRPGTKIERVLIDGRLVALSVFRSGGDGEADRRSSWRSWVREKSWSEIERLLGVADLHRLEVTRRTANGRVVGLAAVSRSGARKEWTGFGIRRALGLPENLFTIQVIAKPDDSTVRFLGRAWGHGVGLCQNGAYGLARAGMTFDRILSTYYPGTRIANQRDLLAPTVEAKK